MKIKKEAKGIGWIDVIIITDNPVDQLLTVCKNKKLFDLLLGNTCVQYYRGENTDYSDFREISVKSYITRHIKEYYKDNRDFFMYVK